MESEIEVSNPSQSSIGQRLGQCEVCGTHEAKYTCPKCEVKTCSLKCNRIHKLEVECDGCRDRTKFVPINKFSNLDLSSDYRLLEEISRNLETAKKNFNKRDDSRFIPPHILKLKSAAEERLTILKFLPYKFKRHQNNTTQLHFKTKMIFWHVEFVFVNADCLKINVPKVAETEKISSVLSKYLTNHEDIGLIEKLKYYQAADITGLRLFLKAEQKRGKQFYELDSNMTLKECLSKKIIIEYPTVHVLLKDHGCAYDVIDSDEDEESEEKDNINTGNEVVKRILRRAERSESLSSTLKNLLFVSEYSDDEISN